MKKDLPDARAWNRLLAPYKRASWGRALFQLADSALPFALLWYLMARSLEVSYLLTLALALAAAPFYIRLFIIQHDCGHGSFFPHRRANNWLGAALGVATLFPYGYWRRTHAIHHATSGNLDQRELGDIETLTVAEYLARPRRGRLAYRLYRHPLVLFGLGPLYQFVIKHRFPFDIPWSWKREWRSVLTTNLALLAAGGALGLALGWWTVLAVQVTVVMVAGPIGVWLFYVQHQFEDTSWERADAWDFYRAGVHGSSFYDLHPVLHWMTGNIGYHHIHHLSSRIPNYRLAACFREIPELHHVTRLTFRKSLRSARLKLWDEERRALVGFADLEPAGERRRAA